VQGSDVLLSDGWMDLEALEQRDETLAMTELIAKGYENHDRCHVLTYLSHYGEIRRTYGYLSTITQLYVPDGGVYVSE